jgi:vacuolar-type H+-ATPase subunit H
MAGYQYMHMEMYAPAISTLKGSKRAAEGKKRKRGSGGWTALQILDEARREVSASHHVDKPQPPEILMGNLDDLYAQLKAQYQVVTENKFRKNDDGQYALDDEGKRIKDSITSTKLILPSGQRSDTPVLLAGVLSSPWAPDDPRSIEWRMDCLPWLKAKFGKNLRAVIAHNDEAFDHIHFFAADENLGNVKALHVGCNARSKAKAEGLDATAQADAFSDAMRALQDDYHSSVASIHGMARMGPGRRRLSRYEWKLEQKQAEVLAETLKKAEAIDDKIRVQGRVLQAVEGRVFLAKMGIQAANDEAESIIQAARLEAEKIKKDADRQLELLKQEIAKHNSNVILFNKARQDMKEIWEELTPERRANATQNIQKKRVPNGP